MQSCKSQNHFCNLCEILWLSFETDRNRAVQIQDIECYGKHTTVNLTFRNTTMKAPNVVERHKFQLKTYRKNVSFLESRVGSAVVL